MKLSVCALFVLYGSVSYGGDNSDNINSGKILQMMEKEKKLNGAAVEVFWELRDKFGMRLRVAGSLIYCGKNELASEIQPKALELILEADKIMDTLDLTLYGINKVSDKRRISLARRAATAATIYMFSADELMQMFEKIQPSFKKESCDSAVENYKDIMQSMQK